MSNKNVKIGIFCTILSALFYGFTPVLVKIVQQSGITPISIIFYRNFFCVIIIAIVSAIKKEKLAAEPKDVKKFTLLSLTGPILSTLCLYSSYQYIAVGTATVLAFLYPVFAAIIAAVFFRDKIGKNRVISLIIACVGLSFFLTKNEGDSQIGVILAVGSAVIYGVYMILMEKLNITKHAPNKVSFYMAISTSLFMLAYGFFTDNLTLIMSPRDYFLCILVASMTSFGAVSLIQIGVRYLSALTASILCLFEPISGFIFGMLILNEVITINQWIGSVVILIGLMAAFIIPSSKKNRKENSTGQE